jgi:outer membrane lipoprotein-sorting protein
MNGSTRLVLAGLLALPLGTAFSAAPRALHMTMRITSTPAKGKPVTQSGEVWIKGNKARIVNGPMVIMNDGKNQMMYMTNNPKKEMMVMPSTTQSMNPVAQLSKQMGNITKKGTKVGTGKILGHTATIYSMPSPDKKLSEKVWVTNEGGMTLPLRDEKRGPQGSQIFEVTALQMNPSLPDSLFVAPAGYKRMQMPTGPPMGGMRPMPKPH